MTPHDPDQHPQNEADFCARAGLVSVDDAWARLRAAVEPVAGTTTVLLQEAIGRTLAEPINAQVAVPPFANSAMDGYALAFSDDATESGQSPTFTLVGRALAGAPWMGTLQPGEAVRIMTGAAIPEGAVSVEMQERVTVNGDQIQPHQALKKGNNIRPAGDDFQAGQTLAKAGETLGVPHIGLLMAAGVTHVTVVRPVKVALFATGDELKTPGEALEPGQIYESNRALLLGLLRDLPVEVTDLGIIPDDPELLRQTLTQAGAQFDLVLSSGGVSVGDSDYTRQILEELGQVHFWRLAIKPGKPLAFGRLNQAWFFGLPGNPVSALATAHIIMLPALRQLAGQPWRLPPTLQAMASEPFNKKPGRRDYQRATLTWQADGTAVVKPAGPQGSHQLSVLARANAFVIIPAAQGTVAVGDAVQVMPFPQSLSGIPM